MFKALMGGARSSFDGRSTVSSSSKSSRRKADSKSISSRKPSRGDDRDRGLGDLSAYAPSSSGSRRGPSSADDTVVPSDMTTGPDATEAEGPIIIERVPKPRDNDWESTRPRRRDRDRSESRERERTSRRSIADELDDRSYRERERGEKPRDPDLPPVSVSMPSSAPGAQFATDNNAPGFPQFPMQHGNAAPPASSPPGQGPSPAPYDPHVHQQFPGQFPAASAEPYRPPNPAGAAADYYGDQGQSVAEQPGVRPTRPPVIPNSQAHLMPASPAANPPPEPSSLGQVGAAAAYFDNDAEPVQSQEGPPTAKPPKPGKPSKPSQHLPSGAVPAAAAAGTAAYGVGSGITSGVTQYPSTSANDSSGSHPQPAATGTPSKPSHTYGVGTGIGVAAAGAAAGYMLGHHHDHPSSPAHSSQHAFQNFEQSSQAGVPPYVSGPGHPMVPAGAAAHTAHVANNPAYYPHGGGALAMQHRHRGPLSKFADFWRDPEGVGRFEDYTETIGVCKYCFDPGTSSLDAPRKHHFHHRRCHSADRYSSSSSSRVNKLSRYHSSEDERGRRRKSRKSSSWLPGVLGYAAKSIFAGKDFDDSYTVRDRIPPSDDHTHSYTYSYTSRGVVRQSGRSSPDEYYYHKKPPRRTRSRSRSSSRSDQHSPVKEAALGAAVGSATLAVSKSRQRSRSRSPSRTERRKDSSSSSSLIDVSRPAKKSAGGLVSFFTSSSENRKKKRSKKSKGFFSRSSSSSSLDADLAFGTGFAKKSKGKKKKGKAKKDEGVDAALLGLGATATALAASSHGRSRSTGQILTARDARANYSSSATHDDDDWVDESEGQSSSSVSSALAYGASSEDSSSDSGSRRWGWRWGSKKNKKKDKRSSVTGTAVATGAGALGAAALASRARHRDSRGSSSAGSLQQVYPVSTSDPSRYDAAKISPSAMAGDQAPLVRPGAIPLQQPQPVTPVSQAVYTTQGSLPGSIPAYSTPAAVPPIFANDYDPYGPQYQGPRDVAWAQEDISDVERRQPYIGDSSPAYPPRESPASNFKRRSNFARDQASVSFDLTREQAERQRRLDRRYKSSRDEFRDEPVQLIDREELAQHDFGRRAYRDDYGRAGHGEGESSKWVEAAAAGAIGAAAASSLVSSRKPNDEEASDASSRRRERRRAERRRVSEPQVNASIVSRPQVEVPQSLNDTGTSVEHVEVQDQRSYRRGSQDHDDYADFFAPEEVRHSPDERSHRVSGNARPRIIERVPSSERQKNDSMNDDTRDMPQFGPEPYENHENLPWQIPRVNVIEPTPPQSINGSVRGPTSPIAPLGEIPEEPKESERPSTGSRVSWGPQETHEYEVPSSSEPEISPPPESSPEIPVDASGKSDSKDVTNKNDFGDDIEFAATVAAATEAAGFDSSYVIDDPKYHKRTSPPGSEDEGTFSPRSKWASHQDQAHGVVESKIEVPEMDESKVTEPSVKHVVEQTLDKTNGNREEVSSVDNDVFSMPGGFDSGDKSERRKHGRPASGDDGASIVSSPAKFDDTREKHGRKDAKDGTDSGEQKSRKQSKKEKRRQRYEEAGESGKRRESEKDEPSSYKDDSDKSFLAERPEMPAAAERNEHGASGLEDTTIKGTSFALTGLGLSEETLHQQLRSRSTSLPSTEKTLDLASKPRSRPSSPEVARDDDESPHRRRPSMPRSATESPTAVPLHFRRPPTSPGLQRSAPGGGSPTATAGSPGSPSQPRHRRLNSVEFRNSREIRPLWLVERHGATKGEPAEEDEPLPSLPSSKTSSRAPSVEDLRTLHDEDVIKSWDTVGLSQSMGERRRPIDLTISTERANQGDGDADLLDSEQATPTAESYGAVEGSAKKEKPKYEFHSPSELLQDPSTYPDMPPSPTMEVLPSAEGSMVGAKDTAEQARQETGLDLQREPVPQPEMDTPTGESSSFAGPGFAGVVDAAMAAAKEGEKEPPEAAAPPENDRAIAAEPGTESSLPSSSKLGDFADVVDAAISREVSSGDKAPADEQPGVPDTTSEEQPSVQLEPSKDLAPEQASDPAQKESAKEPPFEDVATTSSSKKKKKKKGKKGQASQSVDLTSAESMPAAEAQTPAVETTEPEIPPEHVEHHIVAETETEQTPVEAPRDLEIQPQPAAHAIQDSSTAAESHPEPQPTSSAAIEAESEEAVSAPELHAGSTESAVPADEPAEPEQLEDTAALSKKAKREKKKQKKKAKSAAAAEEVTQPSDAPEEVSVQPEEKGPEPTQASTEPIQAHGDVAADVTLDQERLRPVGAPDTISPAEQDTPESHEARDTAEPPELSFTSPVEDVTKSQDEPASLEAPASDARETDQTEPMSAKASEPPSSEKPPNSAEFAAPGSFPDVPPTPEEKNDEDSFHEAVEEQPVTAEQPSEVPSEPHLDAGVESAAPTESREIKAEEKQDEQPKKGKKKKNRKSVSFDEQPEVLSESKPASEPEPEELKEVEPASAQDSPADSEPQHPESERPTPDVSEVPSEAPTAPSEPEAVSAGDVEPTSTAEPTPHVKATEDLHETPVAQAESEPEVPMTAAQKKKAKKEKKKKAKQQSVSSISEEEKPVESPTVEPQPSEEVQPAASEADELEVVETQPTEGAPLDESQPQPAETPEPASTSTEATEETFMPQEEPSADVPGSEESKEGSAEPEQPQEPATTSTAEIATEKSAAEPVEAQPEAPNEALAEEPPAEPEIPMTAAQKKKAKKAKKKQQQQQEQQEAETPVPEEVQAVGTAPASEAALETAPAPEAPSISQNEPSPEAESAEVGKDVEVGPDPESGVIPEMSAPPVGLGISTASSDLPTASEEASTPADVTTAEGETELSGSREPGTDESNQGATADISAPSEAAQPIQDDIEVTPSEPEVPMTAAQKKKAKKEKKKQQKRQSLQQEEPTSEPGPDPEPVPACAEQKDEEQTTEPKAEPQSTALVEESSSGPDEMQASDEAPVTVGDPAANAEVESKVEATPEEEPNQAAVDVENNAAMDSSPDDSTLFSPEQPEEIQPVPEEAATESKSVDAPTANELSGVLQDTLDVPAPQEPVKEIDTSDDVGTEAATSQEPTTPVSVEDAAPEQAEDTTLATPKSKKDKKKKKKRQSLVLEEESQPDAHPERAKEEESTEPAPSENTEVPASTGDGEPAVTSVQSTPEQPPPDGNTKDEGAPEQPVVEPETTAESEPTAEPEREVPMTSAQRKKAKKEKKKRKSVSWDDEGSSSAATPAEPNQEPPATEQSQPDEQSFSDTVSTPESSETPLNTGKPEERPTDNDVVGSEPLAVAPASQSAEATETFSDAAEDTPNTEFMARESSEADSPEVSAGQSSEESQAETPDQTPNDDRPESTTDSKTPFEEPSVTAQGPAEPAEATEPVAEAALSAKERRKLKKKEKKKGQSVDLGTVSTSPIEAPQETEAPMVDGLSPGGSADTEAAKVDEYEPPQPAEGSISYSQIEDAAATEQKVEDEKIDAAGTVKSAGPESVTAERQDAPEQELTEPKDGLDGPPATEEAEESEPAAPKDDTEQIEQEPGPEPEAEVALPAKERRKLKKKEKKRVSKNLDADDNATTADTPPTVATELVQGSTLTETAPAEPEPAAESLAPESDKPISAEHETREISEPVTAPSPAVDDGKEHQSHDIEPSDAPSNDLTSTDEFVSSQVEQPQIESRFSDYPPQSVLERSVDFGDTTSGEGQKEVDVESAVPEAEVPGVAEKATDDVVTEQIQAQENDDVGDEKTQESSPEGVARVEESPVSEEPKEPPVEIAPESTADADVPAPQEQEPAVEEIIDQVLSKKQKKKEKKKTQKQQEQKTEEVSPAETKLSTASQKERPEDATSAQGFAEDTESELPKEPESAPESTPLVDEPSTEPKEDAVESTEPQPPEEKTASTEAEIIANDESQPIDSEIVAPETEPVEFTPITRKLSKKEKKKQRRALISQQLEVTHKPDEQTVSDLGEASASAPEATGISASLDDGGEKKAEDDSVETAAQPQDSREGLEEAAPATAGDQSEESKEKLSTEPSTEVVKGPETEHISEPMGDSAEPATEQPSGDLTVEPDEEWPIVSKKKSKKEKKKAAAAAAAAAIEEDKPTELQTTLEEPPALEESGSQEDLPASSDSPGDNNDNEQHPESAGSPVVKQFMPGASEPEPKPEDIVEDPVEPEPVSRKLPKKEKRKAKKQAKQVPLDLTAAPTEDAPAEDVTVHETEHAGAEGSPVAETTGTVESTETVPGSQPAVQDSPAEAAPEPGPETSEDTDAVVASDAEKMDEKVAIEQADEDNQGTATVSLDPFDVPSPTEGDDRDAPASNDPTPERQEEREDGTEMKLRARASEQQDDLEVAKELFEDRPREPEVVAPSAKKLSKKEKRKAKKKGILEEPHLEQEQETVPEPVAEPEEFDEAVPTPQESEKQEPAVEPEAAVEPEPVRESDPEPEASKDTEPATESQPAAEPETIAQTEPADPEPTPEESEQPLSRKASKKKAKKAKKAALALDLGAPESSNDEPEAAVSPVQEPSKETREVESVELTTQEHKQEDEQWPTIEWEQEQADKSESPQDPIPEPEPVTAVPEAETIGDFDESTIPEALQEVKKEPEEAIEEESWSTPLSKKDKKKAKKNKRKSEQAASAQVEETAPESFHEEAELVSTAPKEIEAEPPVRTTTPGGSKIANLFPGLERGGFRRSALKDSPSLKDSAEEETAADQEANRDIAIPVSEAHLAAIETRNDTDSADNGEEGVTTTAEKDAPVEDVAPKEDSTEEVESPVRERSIADEFPSPAHPASEERSSMLFGSSPSPLTDEPSQEAAGLRRTPSIHGRHEQTARTWSLEEPSLQALQTPSPPRSLFGGPLGEDTLSRPRTPLDPIAEQDPGDAEQATTVQSGTPRLEIKPEHVLPRPVTPVRKFTDNSMARESWPTSENDSSQDSSSRKSPVLQTPEQGGPSLKASGSKGKLRRTNRSTSGDLRAVSRALDSQPPPKSDLDQLPSSSSYDPVTDKGKRPLRNMADVYEGWGETPSSPRSPSRPPSVRRRRSMQHLQDLETRLDQLISENRLLIAARDEAEDRLRNASAARRKSDQALNTRGADLRDKEAEVEQLRSSVEWLQKEMGRLTQENEGLTASNAALAATHAAEVSQVRETSTRELDGLRSQHAELSTNMEDRVRQEIESALAQKDAELRRLREELEDARDKVKELQQQIAASVHDNALVFRDEDYFDAACQKLCGHVQQWVLRFSKHSDHRRCRSLSDLRDEKIADRLDNALLDGSDADVYLTDRVRRRDVFMSVVMTMIWEYVFTRYLFGMDREQRQKLKTLEKQLGEVGPQRAVHRWRATTLTLLSRRPAFTSQRQNDTEAVALEIFDTLSRVLPPPSQVESQLLDSLRKVLRVAVNLSLEMRTQLAEFIMLPPLQPEYDTNGDLTRQVYFNASLMNERSGETSSNEDLEAQQAVVRIVLFPLVVKKGNDVGEGDDEVVVCPAQVLVARPDKRMSKMKSGDRMSIDAARSVHSVAPSVAPSTMDMSNVI